MIPRHYLTSTRTRRVTCSESSAYAAYGKSDDLRRYLLYGSLLAGGASAYFLLFHHDLDGDGLSNWDELVRYRHHGVKPWSADSDGDGITDWGEVYAQDVYIFRNERFSSAQGWPPRKYKQVRLPDGYWQRIELYFEATSPNDKWDRLYSVSLVHPCGREIELHRGITPIAWQLPNSIKSMEDVTLYAPVLRGEVKFGTIITGVKAPWGDRWWDATVMLRFYPGKPPEGPDVVWPIFYMEFVPEGESESKLIYFPSTTRILLTLRATGHAAEEYEPRDIVIKVDGEEIARTTVGEFGRGGWYPGQGTVPPVRLDVGDKITRGFHQVQIEIPGGGRYWRVSLDALLDMHTDRPSISTNCLSPPLMPEMPAKGKK
jgi:hypothetical protein